PSIAFKLFNRFSFGAGLDVQYAAARLTQSVDYGLAGFAAGLAPLGFTPGSRDGQTELYGNDWSVGWNVGGIVEYLRKGEHLGFLDDGRIGVSYRSGITHTLDGDVTFSHTPAPFSNTAPFVNQSASAVLKLPEVYHFSLYQGFAKRFAILGDVTWTRWSRLQEIPITYSNPVSQATFITDPFLNNPGLRLNYRDTFRYAGGFTYQPCERVLLRIGAAYDETPIQSKTTRSTRIPDGDRVFLATGFRYELPFRIPLPYFRNFDLDLDAAYAHLFLPNKPQVDITDTQFHNVRGEYNAHVDIVSASLTFRFGLQTPARNESKDKVIAK
ncbi:MAG: outer membrane protein transport protein, partial [Verrucomicrobia bacterium]|nr:outer membrane protein transport protein [Verrucomicrobiota bacterium]